MQPSDTAKDVPARRNGTLAIKTRLNLDSNHAGPMREKTKASWEHFCNNYLFINKQVRKSMWHNKGLLGM